MTTDNKTLADVQPGGRVRLATVPYDRARDLVGDAYNAGTHGIGYSQQAMELHDAIIPTQPSPGGQGDALALADQLRFIAEGEHSTSQNAVDDTGYLPADVIDTLNRAAAALASRQPVGEPVARVDVLDGYATAIWLSPCPDVKPGQLLYTAPPAQAVAGHQPEVK